MNRSESKAPALRRGLVAACAAAAACLAGAAVQAAETIRVIVAFKPGAVAAGRGGVTAARGIVKHEIQGMDAVAIELPTAGLAGLARNPNVAYVEEDAKRYPLALTSRLHRRALTPRASSCPTASSWCRPTS